MSNTQPRTTFAYNLTDVQQMVLGDILRQGNYRPVRLEHTLIAAETNDCKIALYESGKCLIQGKGAQDFVMFVMEPQVLQQTRVGYEEIVDPEVYAPHIGIDESGKGDFFGPLVIAGAYTDRQLAKIMLDMGVKDSKNISSDKKVMQLAKDIRKLLDRQYSVVTVGPAAYNRLYAKMKNVNRILAWGHARAIENLLEHMPSCPRAISDQFGNKEQVKKALMTKGRRIELVQRPRAESDVAVAAASVLARAVFLNELQKMAAQFDIPISKGASDNVRETARQLVKTHGHKSLLKTAKCHFKTTDIVLKALSLDRSVLGAEGAVTSKTQKPRR